MNTINANAMWRPIDRDPPPEIDGALFTLKDRDERIWLGKRAIFNNSGWREHLTNREISPVYWEGMWRDVTEAPKDREFICLCVRGSGGASRPEFFVGRAHWSGAHWQSRTGDLVVAWCQTDGGDHG